MNITEELKSLLIRFHSLLMEKEGECRIIVVLLLMIIAVCFMDMKLLGLNGCSHQVCDNCYEHLSRQVFNMYYI